MRIETLETAVVNDPEIGDPYQKKYGPFNWLQMLSKFTTEYSLSHTATLCAREPQTALMEAKRDAYRKHVMRIERELLESRGGIIEHNHDYETVSGNIRYTDLERRTHGYLEMLEDGLPINAGVGLLMLRGRGLVWRRLPFHEDDSFEIFRWESELALGLLSENHEWKNRSNNPFKVGWRNI